jgi:hypothetical protein
MMQTECILPSLASLLLLSKYFYQQSQCLPISIYLPGLLDHYFVSRWMRGILRYISEKSFQDYCMMFYIIQIVKDRGYCKTRPCKSFIKLKRSAKFPLQICENCLIVVFRESLIGIVILSSSLSPKSSYECRLFFPSL